MHKPFISVVIPTYNSEKILEVALKGVDQQTCPKNFCEVIIADNNGSEYTEKLAKRYGARILKVDGKAPQVCRQRNLGVKAAKGDYILMLDHDVELEKNFIKNFIKSIKNTKDDVDAWYIHYKIITGSPLLTKIRNFEEEYYRTSVIAAARIIKKQTYWKTENQYDPKLSSGPADWDFNIQLQRIGTKIGYFNGCVYHHEEEMNFWNYINKKKVWSRDEQAYKNKWRRKDDKIYKNVVLKQYSIIYRLFQIFFEKGFWKKTVMQLPLYLLFLLVKITMAANYLYSRAKPKL